MLFGGGSAAGRLAETQSRVSQEGTMSNIALVLTVVGIWVLAEFLLDHFAGVLATMCFGAAIVFFAIFIFG
jgi:hypothetical protein